MSRNRPIVQVILIVVLLPIILCVSAMIYANSCDSDNQMNVDIQLLRDTDILKVTNNNNFSLKNIRFELTANVSDSPFIRQDPILFPKSTRNYILFNFENSDGDGFNNLEMELLGISMYAETVEGEILTAEWDFDNTSNDFVIPTS